MSYKKRHIICIDTSEKIIDHENDYTFCIRHFYLFSWLFAKQPGKKNPAFELEKTKAELKVYPNPCINHKITIDFNSREISEIRLTNIAGKEVLFKKLRIPTNKKQIELGNVPDGLFLIHIKTTDNKMVIKKLIVSSY